MCVLLCLVFYCGRVCFLFFFFFKQKTAYEMRISDWSSDVCSSDLPRPARPWSACDRTDEAGAVRAAVDRRTGAVGVRRREGLPRRPGGEQGDRKSVV